MKTGRLYKALVAGCLIFGSISLWNSEAMLRFHFQLPSYVIRFQDWGQQVITRHIRAESSSFDDQIQRRNIFVYWELDNVHAPLGEKLVQFATMDGIARKYNLPNDCQKQGDIATLLEPPTAKPCSPLQPLTLQNVTAKTITIDITRHYQKFLNALAEANASSASSSVSPNDANRSTTTTAKTKTPPATHIIMILQGTLHSYQKFAPDLKERLQLPTLATNSPLLRFLTVQQQEQQPFLQSSKNDAQQQHSNPSVLVGIHVSRRLGVPSVSFFQHAMTYFQKRYPAVSFVVVSDHPLWCRDVLFHDQSSVRVVIDRFSEAEGLALLAACTHVVVSAGVSSLGWWGAYLGADARPEEERGEIVYYTEKNATEIVNTRTKFPKHWIPIGESGLLVRGTAADTEGAGSTSSGAMLNNVCNNLDFAPKHNKAIVTSVFVDHPGYTQGAVKLAESIRNHSASIADQVDLIVLEIQTRSLSNDKWELLHAAGWQRCVVDRIVEPAGTAVNRTTNSSQALRPVSLQSSDHFTKLHVWGLAMYETLLFMECDTMVIGDIDALLQTDLKALDSKHVGASYDFVRSTRRWAESSFNVGVMLIHPREKEYQRLLRLQQNPNAPNVFPKFLNLVYRNQWHDVGFVYNADLALSSHGMPFWKKHSKTIVILHFTVQKPWSPCIQVYQDFCTFWQNGGVVPLNEVVVVNVVKKPVVETTPQVEEQASSNATINETFSAEAAGPDVVLLPSETTTVGKDAAVPGKSYFTYDANVLSSLNVTAGQLETDEFDANAGEAETEDFDFVAFAGKVRAESAGDTTLEQDMQEEQTDPNEPKSDHNKAGINEFDFDAFAGKVLDETGA